MFHAYQAVALTSEYLDVIEAKIGPEDWPKWKNLVLAGISNTQLRYLIFDFVQDPIDLSTMHLDVPASIVEEMFYTTIGEDETLWIIRKK